MKKIILEEIENMKYLLGYKRGVVISEQDTKTMVVEQSALPNTTTAPASTTPASTAPASTTPGTPIKIGVKYPSIVELQNSLNTKFQTGLTPDGKYGPKTAASILAALTKTSTTNTTPVNTVVGGNASSSEVIKKTAESTPTNGVTNNNTQQSVASGSNVDEIDANSL